MNTVPPRGALARLVARRPLSAGVVGGAVLAATPGPDHRLPPGRPEPAADVPVGDRAPCRRRRSDGHQRGRRRRQRHADSRARPRSPTDSGRRELGLLRRRRPVRRQRPRLLPARAPVSWFWHLWFRENGHRYDWGTLRWCEMTGPPQRLLPTPRTSRSTSSGTWPASTTTSTSPTTATTRTPSCRRTARAKPQVGWNAHVRSGAATSRRSSRSTTCRRGPRLYSTCLDVPTHARR